MIPLVIACVFGAAWPVMARWLYGRWRGRLKALGEYRCDSCWGYSHSRSSDTAVAARAMLAALIWPFVLVTFFVTVKPPPTADEREAANKKLQARVAELEAELGM